MVRVYYKERFFVDRFKCIDTFKQLTAVNYFKPNGTSLYYFRLNDFNYKTISSDELIKIETI